MVAAVRGISTWTDNGGSATTTLTPDVSGVSIASGDWLIAHVAHQARPGFNAHGVAAEGWRVIARGDDHEIGSLLLAKPWGAGFTDDSTPTFTSASSETWGVVVLVIQDALNIGDERFWDDIRATYATAADPQPYPIATSQGASRLALRFQATGDDNALDADFGGGHTTVYDGASYDNPNNAVACSSEAVGAGAITARSCDQTLAAPDSAISFAVIVAPSGATEDPVPRAPRFIGSTTFAVSSGTSQTPDLSPIQLEDNAILLAVATVNMSGGSTAALSAPAGWTSVNGSTIVSSGSNAQSKVWWRRVPNASTEDTSPVFTSGTSGVWGVAVMAYRGCRTTGDPFDDFAVTASYTPVSGVVTFPDADATDDGATSVRIGTSTDDNRWRLPSEGFVALGDTTHQNALNVSMGASYWPDEAAGAVGTSTMTQLVSPDPASVWTIVLEPEAEASANETVAIAGTLGAVSAALTVDPVVEASIAGTLAAVSAALTVDPVVELSVSGTLGTVTAALTVDPVVEASIAGTLGAVTAALDVQLRPEVAIAGTLGAVTAALSLTNGTAATSGLYDQTELGYPLTFMQVQRIELHVAAPNSGTAVTYYKRELSDEWRPLYSQAVAATYQHLSLYVWGIPYVKTELTAVDSDQATVRFQHSWDRAT